jgi:hypothetical protein
MELSFLGFKWTQYFYFQPRIIRGDLIYQLIGTRNFTLIFEEYKKSNFRQIQFVDDDSKSREAYGDLQLITFPVKKHTEETTFQKNPNMLLKLINIAHNGLRQFPVNFRSVNVIHMDIGSRTLCTQYFPVTNSIQTLKFQQSFDTCSQQFISRFLLIEHMEFEHLQRLGRNTFKDHSKIQTITIKSGLLEIKDNTFLNCLALYSFLSGNPSYKCVIGVNAFRKCTCLQVVILPFGISIIKRYAFRDCFLLREIDIQNDEIEF